MDNEAHRTPTRRHRSRTGNSRTDDVTFVSNIGENILHECRRLNGLLQQRETQLRSLEQDQDELKSQNISLESKIKTLATESGMFFPLSLF